ncbi:MAG TPA: glucose 1-dehydrogenase [Bryobacteraceae bacterium]|nr:glucose 1-dehydrogenase [Bryobacteraceae bacterium]
MGLDGKVVLVTGSERGIGQAIAAGMAERGADVAVDYLTDVAGAQKTAAEIQKFGRRSTIVQADVSKTADAQRLVSETIAAMGRLDVLINNAGIEKRAPFWDVTEADYRVVIDVNLAGPFFVAQAFVRYLRDQKRPGKIINISSVHEELPFPHFTSYCMSKGGLKMMMRNLAIELAPLGITVNNIAPGAIATPINKALLNNPKLLSALEDNIPLHRLGTPADVANVAGFLASSAADYITGTTIVVDGGLLWNYSEQ